MHSVALVSYCRLHEGGRTIVTTVGTSARQNPVRRSNVAFSPFELRKCRLVGGFKSSSA